jgi:hypothetical protein
MRISNEPLDHTTVERVRRAERLMTWAVVGGTLASICVLGWDRRLGLILIGLWVILTVQLLLVGWFLRRVVRQRGLK